jgi:uncharacterized protein (TIGR02118 family)
VIKRLTQWRPREDVTSEQALRYWKEQHAPLVGLVPGVTRYVQNHCVAGLDGSLAPFAGLGEVWFNSRESAEEALASAQWSAVIDDAATFMDMASVSVAWAEEYIFAG